MNLPVVILAGGLATRLGNIAKKIPKSLIEIAGQPFISHQLRRIKEQNISDVVICVGHLGDEIKEYVKTGQQYGLKIVYSEEKAENLLGTGGAVVNALPKIDNDAFFIQYGDSLLDVEYKAVCKSYFKSQLPSLMVTYQNCNQWDKSNVEVADGQIQIYSKNMINQKMTYIDYGLGVLSKGVFAKKEHGMKFDLSEIYEKLAGRGELAMFEAKKRFYEIGSSEGILECEQVLSRGDHAQ